MTLLNRCAVGLFVAITSSVAFAQTRAPIPDVDAIAAMGRALSEAYVNGDAEAVSALYTNDARLYPPGRVVEGREAIRTYFTIGPNRKQLAHSMKTESLDVDGDVAIETGTWSSTWKAGDADPVTSSDRYLIIWKKQPNDRWLIDQDWWHRPATPVTNPAARPMTVERTEIRNLESEINGVEYELRVALPHSYGAPGKRYPVVYLLDADYSFFIARNILDHLSERNNIGESIVVGIAYGGQLQYRLNRTRDYTPTLVPTGGYGPEYQKVSGGAPMFRDVIRKEIIPFIDGNYATVRGDRTLVGHSYGGLFTTWVMFTEPDLFSRYIAVSPSLWYDDHLIFRIENELAKTTKRLPVHAYFCVGSREHNDERNMVTDLDAFLSQVRQHQYEGLELGDLVMTNETHNSVFPGGLSNGLRFVFEGW